MREGTIVRQADWNRGRDRGTKIEAKKGAKGTVENREIDKETGKEGQ